MIRISQQLMMMLLVVLVAGCATEKYSLRRIVGRPRFQQSKVHPNPPNSSPQQALPSEGYEPVPQEEIPLPPSGASYEESRREDSHLKKAERPPLLLRPVGWEFRQPEPIISLRPPKAN